MSFGSCSLSTDQEDLEKLCSRHHTVLLGLTDVGVCGQDLNARLIRPFRCPRTKNTPRIRVHKPGNHSQHSFGQLNDRRCSLRTRPHHEAELCLLPVVHGEENIETSKCTNRKAVRHGLADDQRTHLGQGRTERLTCAGIGFGHVKRIRNCVATCRRGRQETVRPQTDQTVMLL